MVDQGRLLTAIDVGSHKVCTIVALLEEGEPEVIGIGVAPSHGVRRGQVVDLSDTCGALRASVGEAERSSGVKIRSALVGVTGTHIDSKPSMGLTTVARRDQPRTITEEDLGRAMEQASTINIPGHQEILHVVPRSYTLDGLDGVQRPVGLHGYRLEVETTVVTAASDPLRNLVDCLRQVGVAEEGLVLSPWASAEAVLREDEREMGVVLADIGEGTTDVAIFREGSLLFTQVLGLGGYHLTKDLVYYLQVPTASAEGIKERHGHALPSEVDLAELVSLSAFGSNGERPFPRHRIAEILHVRLEELLRFVRQRVEQGGFEERLPAGLVLTGGTANLPGLEELAHEVTGWPVRIGIPDGVQGQAQELRGPEHATAVGLVLWGVRYGAWQRAPRSLHPWLAALLPPLRWVRDFFP